MKKSAILLIATGFMIFSGVQDVDAFLGIGKKSKATSASISNFGVDAVPLRKAVDNLKSGVTSMRKTLASASSDILKHSTEVKAFSDDVQIAVPAYISLTLDNISAALDVMEKNLKLQSDGLNEIAKTKTGGAHFAKGKIELKMATDLSEIGEQVLAVTETNIVCLLKVINNDTNKGVPIINRGKITTIIQKLEKVFTGAQKHEVIAAMQEYQKQLEKVKNIGNSLDRYVKNYYSATIDFAQKMASTFSLYSQFLQLLEKYVSTNNSTDLSNFVENKVKNNVINRLKNAGYVQLNSNQMQRFNQYQSMNTQQREDYDNYMNKYQYQSGN